MNRNRVLAAILTLAMVLMMTPQLAFESYAATSTTVAITDTVGGQPTSVGGSADASGNGWSWDSSTGKLTLSGFNGENITATGAIEIVLNGSNTITLGDDDTSIYGIYAKDGSVTISSRNNSQSDQLTIKKENISPASAYSYFYAIYAFEGININGGHVRVLMTEAAGNTRGFTPMAFSPGNGDNRVSGSASVDVDIQCPNRHGRGFIRSLFAETSGDINVNIDGAESTTESAIDYLVASGSGNITASNPNAIAVDDRIDVSDGAGDITLNGRITLRQEYYFNYFRLPDGYAFTETGGDCGFLMTEVRAGRKEPVLCKADGTEVRHTVIKNVGVSNAPLKFLDSPNFDITGAKVGEGYSGQYFSGFVSGGVAPYTYTATGLPEGLELYRTTASVNHYFGNYIKGEPTKACPAGNATITVTDAAGTSKSITIHYDAIAVPPKYLEVGGTRVNMSQDANGTGWIYKAATSTITLDGYNGGPIISEAAINVVLKNNNVINMATNPSSDASYGINTLDGKIAIDTHSDYPNSKLVIKAENLSPSRYLNYEAIRAFDGVDINGGHIQIFITEAAGNTQDFKPIGISPGNGDNRVSGSASVDIDVQCPNQSGRGFIRNLYAETTGDINVNIDGAASRSESAIDYLCASGSGSITASYPKGIAVDDAINVTAGAGDITLDGRITLRQESRLPAFHLPGGYAFTETDGDCGFLVIDVNQGGSYAVKEPVLCRADGSEVRHAVIKNVGVANAPLKFLDSANFDITGARVGTYYNGAYFSGFVTGGVAPYTFSASGLPEGLSVERTETPYGSSYTNRIVGTPTAACDEGDATITVSDATGAKKTITIHYDAIFSGAPVAGIAFTDPAMASVTMKDGEKMSFAANVLPANATDRSVSWSLSSSDCGYISANNNTAEFTATNPGVVKLTARAFGGYKAISTITVKEKTPDIKYYVTGDDAAVLQGFDYSGRYEISAGSYSTIVEDSYYTTVTPEMRGKTISITKINDNPACSSEAQQLAIPSHFTPEPPAVNPIFAEGNPARIAGASRYETSIKLADAYKDAIGVGKDGKVDNVVVAYGGNYPDALAGGYVATEKNAPLITVDTNAASEGVVYNWIKDNMKSGGTVYILGGTGVVRPEFENKLKNNGVDVVRYSGASRFDTNMDVLNKVGVHGELLLCSAYGYADSLGASATGKPIMLVGPNLTADQKKFIKDKGISKITIIGGTGAVSATVEKEAKSLCGNVERAYGANRYDTSIEVAKAFTPSFDTVVTVYGQNFPDGLSAGPVAYALNAPLLLATSDVYKPQATFVKTNGKAGGSYLIVVGGPTLISNAAAKTIAGV